MWDEALPSTGDYSRQGSRWTHAHARGVLEDAAEDALAERVGLRQRALAPAQLPDVATEIAGLICAADVARKNGDQGRAAVYEARADFWQQKVESWTASTNGPYSPRPYYLRVTKDARPNAGTTYNLGDNFDRPVDQREIVDNSFFGLVLFGVKPWNDQTVVNSLVVGDSTSAYPLKVNTPERSGVAPLHLRRLRRAGRRARLGSVLRQPGAPDARAPVAAADGRARRVRADRGR